MHCPVGVSIAVGVLDVVSVIGHGVVDDCGTSHMLNQVCG